MTNVLQLEVGGFDKNYSYLVTGTGANKNEAILIDPAGSAAVIKNAIQKNRLNLVLILLTNSHPDHMELASRFASKSIKIFEPKGARLGHEEALRAAGQKIRVIHTPGHTKESVCYLIGKNLFCGDTIFVWGIGTTAYGGDDRELKESLEFLSTLDKKLLLWPGHNYGGSSSTLGEALTNSHIRPSKEVLKKLKKKVAKYESAKKK